MTQIQEIETKIESLKYQLNNVRGTSTEVYTRIVGYYRPVSNWNAGKEAERKIRKYFGGNNGHKCTFRK